MPLKSREITPTTVTGLRLMVTALPMTADDEPSLVLQNSSLTIATGADAV